MKYCGHESFSIRKDWLAKGIRKINSFKKDELTAMDELGIGKNMVISLRYWLKVTGITNDDVKKKKFELSDFGKLIKENDPYTEELGTLWLLHYKLSTNLDNATTWYFFFNEFNVTEFSNEEFLNALTKWDEMNNSKPAAHKSISKDFDCLKRTYLSKYSEIDIGKNEDCGPESNMECPLTELGLLKLTGKGIYRKTPPLKNTIPSLIVLAAIIDQAKGQKEIKLSTLQNEKYSIGKIFNLDSILMINILSELENRDLVQVVRTAGLDILRIKTEMSFKECINKYYEELGNE